MQDSESHDNLRHVLSSTTEQASPQINSYLWTSEDDRLLLEMFTFGIKKGTDPTFIAEAFSDAVGVERSLRTCMARFAYLNSTAVAAWAEATARTKNVHSNSKEEPSINHLHRFSNQPDLGLLENVGATENQFPSCMERTGTAIKRSISEVCVHPVMEKQECTIVAENGSLSDCKVAWTPTEDNALQRYFSLHKSRPINWLAIRNAVHSETRIWRTTKDMEQRSLSLGLVDMNSCNGIHEIPPASEPICSGDDLPVDGLLSSTTARVIVRTGLEKKRQMSDNFRNVRTPIQKLQAYQYIPWSYREENLLIEASKRMLKPSGMCDWDSIARFMNNSMKHKRSVCAYRQRHRVVEERCKDEQSEKEA